MTEYKVIEAASKEPLSQQLFSSVAEAKEFITAAAPLAIRLEQPNFYAIQVIETEAAANA